MIFFSLFSSFVFFLFFSSFVFFLFFSSFDLMLRLGPSFLRSLVPLQGCLQDGLNLVPQRHPCLDFTWEFKDFGWSCNEGCLIMLDQGRPFALGQVL